MADTVFDRETLLDVTVNIIPLGILSVFFVMYMTWKPWTGDALTGSISIALVVVPFVLLAALTYFAAKEI